MNLCRCSGKNSGNQEYGGLEARQLGMEFFIRRCWQLPGHQLQRPTSHYASDFVQPSTTATTGWPTSPPVCLPPGFQSPSVSYADSTLTGFRAVDCPLRLRVDDGFACYREDDRDWMNSWRTQQSCSASRHATPHFSPLRRSGTGSRIVPSSFFWTCSSFGSAQPASD